MRSKLRSILIFVVSVIGVLAIFYLLSYFQVGARLFSHRSPVPAFAENVQRITPSSLDDLLGLRRTSFRTDQPAEAVQDFYLQEMGRRGWKHLCKIQLGDPPCGEWMFIDMNEPDRLELVEVYERGRAGSSSWRTFEVGISPPGVDGYRNVWIDDPSRGTIPVVSYISPQTEQILGNWKPVNASEADYILRFDETKKVVILIPELSSGSGLDGEFEWVGENRLRLTFNWYFQPAAIEDGVCTKYVPSLFKQFCQHNLSEYDASGYPEPPVYYPSPYSPPTSMPTPAPGAIDTIDEVFKVEIDGETLVLIHESGARLTLQKLIGK